MPERMWKRILRRKPNSPWSIVAFFLWLASLVYRIGFVLKRCWVGEPVRVTVPVISVGNITVGGSGKTPIVARLAEGLIGHGFRVGIVSSGYGRSENTAFLAPGKSVLEMDVAKTGDEVKLLAQLLPKAVLSVDSCKWRAAQKLADSGKVDLIIVDDGFQHFKLARDIDLVAFDATLDRQLLRPFPCGVLRESLKALGRANIVFITRTGLASDLDAIEKELREYAPQSSFYRTDFGATMIVGYGTNRSVKCLEGKTVLLFAGVGNFDALAQQVQSLSAKPVHTLEFSDHQRYSRPVLEMIRREAEQHHSDLILTTLKDWVKVGNFDFGREFYYLEQTVDLEPDADKLLAEIKSRLNLITRGT